MPESDTVRSLEAVVRGVATAAKTLRLYPPSSPIPRQSAQAARDGLSSYLAVEPVLALAVARDGFSCRGEQIAPGMPGASDLADMLRSHGVAELAFLNGCETEELLSFLGTLSQPPEDVRGNGGLGALLAAKGVQNVRVTDVALTVAEDGTAEKLEDVDEFLRQLATDPDKLAEWVQAAAAHGDPAALAEGIAELRRAAAADGGKLAGALAAAFEKMNAEGRDAILGVAMESENVRDVTSQAFGQLGNATIAEALCGGQYGQNMLSLSSALTRLPLAERLRGVFGEVSAALEQYGHTPKEAEFLQHMLDVRSSSEPESPLSSVQSYLQFAEAARASDDEIGRARGEASDCHEVSRRSVATLLALLDQQRDFDLYCRAADALAATVPALLKQGDVALATRVIDELAGRAGRAQQPWPGLEERLRDAVRKALSGAAIRGLLEAIVAEPARATEAQGLVRHAGDAATETIAQEGIALKEPGLVAAERLIGRRLVDQLALIAPRLQWYQLAPVVRRLAAEDDQRAAEALRTLAARPDEQSRREVAQGLAEAGERGVKGLATLLRDPSGQVAITAARSLARSGGEGAARALGARLAEMDVDGKDFALGRELIGALARTPGRDAAEILEKLAARRALIKRGHFAEVQAMARQAVELQRKARGGAA